MASNYKENYKILVMNKWIVCLLMLDFWWKYIIKCEVNGYKEILNNDRI